MSDRWAGRSRCPMPMLPAFGLLHQRGLADFQSAAHLSAGWRSDPSIPALVCDGARPQLMAATIVGFVGAAGFILVALRTRSAWFGLLSFFILTYCWRGLKQARALYRFAKAPRHEGFVCPSCKAPPPIGAYWICPQCQKQLDTFQAQAACPYCATQFPLTACVDCGVLHPLSEWVAREPVPSPL